MRPQHNLMLAVQTIEEEVSEEEPVEASVAKKSKKVQLMCDAMVVVDAPDRSRWRRNLLEALMPHIIERYEASAGQRHVLIASVE